MIQCDDECGSTGNPIAVAVVGAVGTVLAALAVPWMRSREAARAERRDERDRLVRLETAYEIMAAGDAEEEDE